MSQAERHPSPPDLSQLEFRQIVGLLESTDAEAAFETPDRVDFPARFPELAGVEVRDVVIDGMHGEVAGRVYRGSGAGGPGLVWVHGGAFIGGGLDMPEAHWVSLVLAAQGFPVLSLDYRKALRGVHYPAPSDDVLAGWLWARAHAGELGAAPEDLHLGGASAGGNLVAGVTKRLRDGAGPLPASLVLVYPAVHAELPPFSRELEQKLDVDEAASSGSPTTLLFKSEQYREMTFQYAGSEDVMGDPYAFAPNGDLTGQPPVFIMNSETDSLRASGEAYGDGLRLAGVEVTVETVPGTHHGHLSGPEEPGALYSVERLATWLRDHHTA